MHNLLPNMLQFQLLNRVNKYIPLLCLFILGFLSTSIQSAEETPTTETTTAETTETPVVKVDETLARQKDLAKRITTQDTVWLSVDSKEWLALYHQDETGVRKGTVILIPAPGLLPTQPKLISLLAEKLPSKGWSTLSVSVPFDTAVEKESGSPSEKNKSANILNAAIQKALELHRGDIYLVIHGQQHSLIAQAPKAIIKGVVFINIPSDKKTGVPKWLLNKSLPILDIIGDRDPIMDRYSWKRRKNMARSIKQPYRQLIFPGINKNFTGLESSLTRSIGAWLNKNHTETK